MRGNRSLWRVVAWIVLLGYAAVIAIFGPWGGVIIIGWLALIVGAVLGVIWSLRWMYWITRWVFGHFK